ncbi:DUF547 domain-containing protein [Alteromonas sp. CYL-A6]|uniref:DUF547 domain-containing protein n=1 Tax=Alteromonas nitratireducens TaxID=3390813 RepID=UPI0034B808F6
MKRLLYTFLMGLVGCTSAAAEPLTTPTEFTQSTPGSTLQIMYDDVDAFLAASVYVVGPSSREKAPRPVGVTGTLLKPRINRVTALEGNRFYFDNFANPEYVALLTSLQRSLIAVADELILASFSRDEQLAYWLNLYNLTLLSALADQYPVIDPREFYDADSALFSAPRVTVQGVTLSLNDIHHRILGVQYAGKPEVMYGLYQAVIGAPSLQPFAFKGPQVWQQLARAASDFINSNRGTYYDGRVSHWYQRNAVFYNDDKEQLKAHMLRYLKPGTFYAEINSTPARLLAMDIRDIDLADLSRGRQYGAGLMNNRAALMDAARVSQPGVAVPVQNYIAEGILRKAMQNSQLNLDDIERLQKMKNIRLSNQGSVSVVDLSETEAMEPTKK